MTLLRTLGIGTALLALIACDNTAKEKLQIIEEAEVGTQHVDESAEANPSAEVALAAAAAFMKENGAREGVITTKSGLQYEITQMGEGRAPETSDVVVIQYRGRKISGEIFDNSYETGGPIIFPINQVGLAGWREGLQLLNAGSKAVLYVPPELGFGATGVAGDVIGPNEMLMFDVELLEVIDPEANPERIQTIRDEQHQRAQEAFAKLAVENAAKAEAFLSENAIKKDVIVTESGLQYQVISQKDKTARRPKATDMVEVHYHGTLADGRVFDSSVDRGETISFLLTKVIPGWTEGLQLMAEGDKFRFFIPPSLAYGARGSGHVIGPNSVLIFDVELMKVSDAPLEGVTLKSKEK